MNLGQGRDDERLGGRNAFAQDKLIDHAAGTRLLNDRQVGAFARALT